VRIAHPFESAIQNHYCAYCLQPYKGREEGSTGRRSARMLEKEVAVCVRNHYPPVSPHATGTKITPLSTITHFVSKARGAMGSIFVKRR